MLHDIAQPVVLICVGRVQPSIMHTTLPKGFQMTERIKKGSKVKIKSTDEIVFVHENKVGKPYPFYVHEDENVPVGTELRGPYGRDQIEVVQ